MHQSRGISVAGLFWQDSHIPFWWQVVLYQMENHPNEVKGGGGSRAEALSESKQRHVLVF
jgi:hypothetical protein